MSGSKQREKQRVSKLPDHPNLNAGGTPGNKGGGTIKSEIRELSMVMHRRLLKKLLARAESKALANRLSDSDLLRLLDICGKYGTGSKVEIEIPNGQFASIVVQTALTYISPDKWDEFDAAIRQVLGDGDVG